jgi:hypothetical protein
MNRPEFLHKYQPMLPCSHRPEFEHDLFRLVIEEEPTAEEQRRQRAEERMESL